MLNKVYSLGLAILLTNIIKSTCYVNYEIFKGFDYTDDSENQQRQNHLRSSELAANNTEMNIQKNNTNNLFWVDNDFTVMTTPTTVTPTTTEPVKDFFNGSEIKISKLKCPETEPPNSLGTYEIPTKRDLMLFTKRILLKMFNSYHAKTLLLLKDIKEATRNTLVFESNCRGGNKLSYKNCVKRVSKKCVTITKNLVSALEVQRQSVTAILEETVCSLDAFKTDPIHLVKRLAMEEVSLEFALPAFLRLIGGCAAHCSKPYAVSQSKHRPARHMTDQDLVVRHFLTSKNYLQLIKDSDVHERGSKNAALVNWMHSAHL